MIISPGDVFVCTANDNLYAGTLTLALADYCNIEGYVKCIVFWPEGEIMFDEYHYSAFENVDHEQITC